MPEKQVNGAKKSIRSKSRIKYEEVPFEREKIKETSLDRKDDREPMTIEKSDPALLGTREFAGPSRWPLGSANACKFEVLHKKRDTDRDKGRGRERSTSLMMDHSRPGRRGAEDDRGAERREQYREDLGWESSGRRSGRKEEDGFQGRG
ncbi:hypothetical protein DFP72DRAFT_1052304 [Ephemerocybe angulata]|uniref:Uncharacterized protein n=1 Tax=Ephemerocybe angulata TaxID=980116 RepID=A0A8H6LWT5_9AGAR|nr:hypothetical protein DFP72DRAFT_1052304 [Tulosesus angulatus]